MLNLLPTDLKDNIVYARRNTRMRYWTIALLLSIIGILGIVAVSYIYLQQSINTYASDVQKGNDNLKSQKLDETQKQVQDLTNNLKLVDQVLQREVLFSKLLLQIGSALPNGSVLTNLSIDKIQGGLNLDVATTDDQTATQVQINLQDPENKIFDKADIITIQCATATAPSANSAYPCTVQIRALFAKNNSFSVLGGVKSQ